MHNYRIFEVDDLTAKVYGIIPIRMDEEDKTIFKKIRDKGFNVNRRFNRIVWWNDDYAEIVNKFTDLTIGTIEMCYS